ncbi:hypothetical protein ACNSOL_12220 (plasmid) [Aliarcobacter lanthieri]|uniref:hypothetical protein n=1 Tax=Aliarcobacter lanthieri TaxID=1355374 RepID=UPI003AAE8560
MELYIIFIVGMIFFYFDYKRKLKSLKSFKGLGKLTKITNDIHFCKEEKDIFLKNIKKIERSIWINLFFTTMIMFLSLYLTKIFYIWYAAFLMQIETALIIFKLRNYILTLKQEFI